MASFTQTSSCLFPHTSELRAEISNEYLFVCSPRTLTVAFLRTRAKITGQHRDWAGTLFHDLKLFTAKGMLWSLAVNMKPFKIPYPNTKHRYFTSTPQTALCLFAFHIPTPHSCRSSFPVHFCWPDQESPLKQLFRSQYAWSEVFSKETKYILVMYKNFTGICFCSLGQIIFKCQINSSYIF